MTAHPIPSAALAQHTAILAKTGAGKTTTAKGVVEHVVLEENARVCILDPIKSDWWGLISSADGKKPGLPFNILGGPHGHVPLNSAAGKAIGELVGSGALPLSIVDMADFEPGGVQRFFVDFAPALLKAMRGVLYLVLEEAHEFAPKERAGFGAENMAIHFAKKLATAGRSKGIRLIVVTHRVQSLHNAVLGSCDTLIAQRLTAPADQEPVIKWLKANASKDVVDQVSSSLSSLPTGTGWIISGEARVFERVAFPMITTFDNSKTPTKDTSAPAAVKSATVDQAQLRALIGEAVTQAEADDPAKLRARIAELERKAPTPVGAGAADLATAYDRGFAVGVDRGRIAGFDEAKSQLLDLVGTFVVSGRPVEMARIPISAPSEPVLRPAATKAEKEVGPATDLAPAASEPLTKSLIRCLNSLAWWKALGFDEVSRDRAAVIAGLSPTASTFGVYVSKLQKLGLVENGSPGTIRLTEAGVDAAEQPVSVDPMDVFRMARAHLGNQAARVLECVGLRYPEAISRDDLADQMGLSRTASTLGVYLSESSKLGFIENAGPGMVRAAGWLFPGARRQP